MTKKIFISTGGSGGHVIPAITIYDHLKKNFKILICTDNRGLKYLENENCKPIIIDTPRLDNFFLIPYSLIKVFILTIKSIIFLKKEKVSTLISTGGYMSLPLCLAAKVLSIKIFLVEPNMVLGRANKFFLNFSKKLLCYSKNLINFPNKFEQKKIIIKPLIRKKYYEKNDNKDNNSLFTVIIIGGSQGANIFDTLLHEILLNCSKIRSLKIIHQTSQKNLPLLRKFYKENKIESEVFTFDQNLNELLKKSDLCITRAGASSLAEISLLSVPFIAIPLPSSKDNHQYENAKYYNDKDCCWIFDQNNFQIKKFEELLLNISTKNNEYLVKKNNLKKLNYQNTWNNVNQNLIEIFNEN